jgi:hypothetical protein
LLAILALEPEESAPSATEAQAFGKKPLPTLDARVEMFMRAMRDAESGADDPAHARELILTAMAKDLENGSEQNGERRRSALFEPHTRRFNRDRRPSRSGFRAPLPSANRRLRSLGGGTFVGRLERRMALCSGIHSTPPSPNGENGRANLGVNIVAPPKALAACPSGSRCGAPTPRRPSPPKMPNSPPRRNSFGSPSICFI